MNVFDGNFSSIYLVISLMIVQETLQLNIWLELEMIQHNTVWFDYFLLWYWSNICCCAMVKESLPKLPRLVIIRLLQLVGVVKPIKESGS